MDGYIIQKIALYVKEASIVKLLFYIPEYRNLIKTSDYHYDELVLNYSNKDWMTNNLKLIKSFYRFLEQSVVNNRLFDNGYSKHMNLAAENGNLKLIKWLHNNRTEGCTKYAMNVAAAKGYLKIIKWLHKNRTEGCTTDAMDQAACYGHLKVVKWLHYNRNEGCTKCAMDYAVENGHLKVIKWLYKNYFREKIN